MRGGIASTGGELSRIEAAAVRSNCSPKGPSDLMFRCTGGRQMAPRVVEEHYPVRTSGAGLGFIETRSPRERSTHCRRYRISCVACLLSSWVGFGGSSRRRETTVSGPEGTTTSRTEEHTG